jgi:hypothetical protein
VMSNGKPYYLNGVYGSGISPEHDSADDNASPLVKNILAEFRKAQREWSRDDDREWSADRYKAERIADMILKAPGDE